MEISELTTEQIIELALNEEDGDKRWEYVVVLHKRPKQEVFDASKSLCESGKTNEIALGADILGQLGTADLPFQKETIPILLKLADSNLNISSNEEDSFALQSIIIALGRMYDDESFQKIATFKNHQSEDVRYAVAFGLLFVREDFAIKALIELSNDTDEDVRDWATFGLGQNEVDSTEIREALFQRLNEKVGDELTDEIRGEALLGLALRKDERVVELLIKELSLEWVGILAVEAASEIADKRLCEPLLKIKDWWDVDKDLLNQAIENCCQNK